MIGAQALREKYPHGDGGRVHPTEPTRSHTPERGSDRFFGKQRRKQETRLATGPLDRRLKCTDHHGLLATIGD